MTLIANLGWLGDAVTLIGGGLIGWVSRVFAERDRLRKMRRRLYRELGLNYMRLRVGIEYVVSLPSEGRKWDGDLIAFVPLMSDYYEHARKDMDVFVELKEGYALDAFYQRAATHNESISADVTDTPDAFLYYAIRLSESVESAFAHGPYDLRLAKRLMHENHFRVLEERVRAAPTSIDQLKEAADLRAAVLKAEADQLEDWRPL